MIMFGTDHPYNRCGEAVTIEYITDTKLIKKQTEEIYFKNAENLYGIGE